jgi:uncharacterized membrane protein
MMPNRVRRCVLALIITLSAVMSLAGCDAQMTVEEAKSGGSSSRTSSAAALSGSTYATGGPYKTVQSMGGETSDPRQSSSDGKYKVK